MSEDVGMQTCDRFVTMTHHESPGHVGDDEDRRRRRFNVDLSDLNLGADNLGALGELAWKSGRL